MARIWQLVGRAITDRTRTVAAVLVLVTVVLGAGTTRLEFETSQASLVSPSSHVYEVNERYQDAFGGQPMFVVLNGPVRELLQPDKLAQLRALEDDLRATGRFPAVLGPVTALDFAAEQLAVMPGMLAAANERERAAATDDASRQAVDERFAGILATEAGRLGEVGEQTLDNPAFAEFLLTNPDGSIRAALADNFLDEDHALLIVRLEGNADIADEGAFADEVRAVVDRHPIDGFEVLTTGAPVLLQEINDYLRGGMATLGALAAAVMLLVLWLVFRARYRLLSLGVVVVGLVWAFGALGYLGVPLSMVTISGLPILLGLGVDFAVQTHNRFDEEVRTGAGADAAVGTAMTRMAPPLTVAMIAAVAGFLALQLSAVPMIDDFGVMLAVGMVVLVVEATVLVTLLLWRLERRPTPVGHHDGAIDRFTKRATRLAPRWALGLAAAGVVLGIAGFAAEGRTPIQTDPEAWVGTDSDASQQLSALRDVTGYSAELGFLVEADDVLADDVVAWVDDWSNRQVAAHPDELVHATSLASIVSSVTTSTPAGSDIESLLTVAPDDVRVSFLADRSALNLVFPVANLSLEEREELLAAMVADLDPPPGVTVEPSGLVVLGIELVDNLEATRQLLTLAALALVAGWLLVCERRLVGAVLPLVPVVMAVGASSLVIYLLGLELTPLTTVSGPLAIAITTEFSLLLVARYREELDAGAPPDLAVDLAAHRIGRAFLASGLTLLGGFVVLAFSPMPLLLDFGVVVAIDVAVALLSVLTILPPLLRRTAPWIEAHHHHLEAVPAEADPSPALSAATSTRS